MALAAGTSLGPYELIEAVGAGGMGEVYRARDPRLGREVAIKVLPASFASDASRLRRFEQEAHGAATLNHPNVLAVYDVGTHRLTTTEGTVAIAAAQECPYIVSELLDGETLREALRGGPLSVRKTVDYAQQMARGLGAAHDKGIVHRDLKPENIFITEDGRVKILDFGLAKLTRPEIGDDGQTLTCTVDSDPGTVLGTVGYMSPEQVRGKPADARSDLFSFGAILYEMLSGKRAFKGESAAETMVAILKEEPPELTETNRTVPRALERIARHCLEKNPAERFQSARDVAFDLETLTSASAAAAAPALSVAVKHGRMQRAALAAGVVLVAIAAGIGIGYKVSPSPLVPTYEQLTFRRGEVYSAKFAPNGQVIYSAAWEGNPPEVFTAALGGRGSASTGIRNADIEAVSLSGDVLLVVDRQRVFSNVRPGTLARMPLSGAAPRPLLKDVEDADWGADGESIAVARYVGQRSRLEFPVGKVLYQSDGYVSAPRVSPKGDRVAFLDHPLFGDDMGAVAVVDLAGHKRVLSPQYASIQTLQWTRKGDELWFSAAAAGASATVYAVSLAGRMRTVARAPGGLTLFDIAAGGRVLAAQGHPQVATVARGPGQKQERDLSVADFSFPIAFSSDGATLVVDEQSESPSGQYAAYLRKIDGSPPVKLGEGGEAHGLSPDGQWVLATSQTTPSQLFLLPTGVGEAKPVSHDEINHRDAVWLPDNKHVVFLGIEPGKQARIYVQGLDGGPPRPITPEGISGAVKCSPDGKMVSVSGEHIWIVPLDGGAVHVVPGTSRSQFVVTWSADSRRLYTATFGEKPAKLYRMDPASGKSEFVRLLAPADPAGVRGLVRIVATPDLKAYAYAVWRNVNELYAVEGLK